MEANGSDSAKIAQDKEYRKFLWSRIILGIAITIGVIWISVYVFDRLLPAGKPPAAAAHESAGNGETGKTAAHASEKSPEPAGAAKPAETDHPESPETGAAKEKTAQTHGPAGTETPAEAPAGIDFVNRLIKPLEYELKERFWGWRPNDILNFTDNVNEIQLGVLEATRRGTVYLTERISRRGSAEALNPHLENAMNWLMVNPKSYWFPSAESKYTEAIAELGAYREKLEAGHAGFYTRADNLIPLLKAFEELLGSCDDNLVKLEEKDGDPVSTFSADNYFYYAKGVAMAMDSILKGVEHEFRHTLEVRGGLDILHHAIHSCHIAAGLDPWLWITEGSLNGIFANHRANMAAHISHARFYVNLLVETLST